MSTDASSRLDIFGGAPWGATALGRLSRAVAWSAAVLVALAGLVLLSRRAGGSLAAPLPGGVLAALGAALALLALAFRRIFAGHELSPPRRAAAWAAPSLVLAVWAAALWLPGSGTLGVVIFCGALLMEEGWSWGRWPLRFDPPQRSAPAAAVFPASHLVLDPPEMANAQPPNEVLERDAACLQQIVRRQTPEGETIEGWLRVDFAAAERHAAAHVAICPPFARLPECYAEQSAGPDAEVKVAQVLTHGVRFEIKLDRPAPAAASVAIEFSIQGPPPAAA